MLLTLGCGVLSWRPHTNWLELKTESEVKGFHGLPSPKTYLNQHLIGLAEVSCRRGLPEGALAVGVSQIQVLQTRSFSQLPPLHSRETRSENGFSQLRSSGHMFDLTFPPRGNVEVGKQNRYCCCV